MVSLCTSMECVKNENVLTSGVFYVIVANHSLSCSIMPAFYFDPTYLSYFLHLEYVNISHYILI